MGLDFFFTAAGRGRADSIESAGCPAPPRSIFPIEARNGPIFKTFLWSIKNIYKSIYFSRPAPAALVFNKLILHRINFW
jgi:hypothetical protein